jgi:signal transduction histidine kinase
MAIAVTVLVTGVVIFSLFRASVERETHADLEANLDRLAALIEPEAAGVSLLREPLPDPRYELPYGGVYWQIEAPDGSILERSRSLWDVVLTTVPRGGSGPLMTLAGPDDQSLAAMTRLIEFDASGGAQSYLVTVAEDRSILDRTISEFGGDMAVALTTLALAIFAAAAVVLHVGLGPLDAVRRGVEAVRRGVADRIEGDYPTEVQPLVREVNDLLALRDKSVEFARTRASDLAHALKTPLQVLAAKSDKLRKAGDTASAETIDDILEEMSDRVDYHLRLARLRLRSESDFLSTPLQQTIARTVAVLQQTQDGESLDWRIDIGPSVAVNVDSHDLLELVGVLLENAAKWARSLVEVKARSDGSYVEVTIADDGPGLTAQQIAEIGVRGRRADDATPGSGMGLAIAMEILDLNNGSAELGRSEHGGLEVKLRLPVADEAAADMSQDPD